MRKLKAYKIGYKINGKTTPEDDYIWCKAENAKDAKEQAKSNVWLRLAGKKRLFVA